MFTTKKELELTYADTDMMGVIYHANYLKYFEIGRNNFTSSIGLRYLDLEAAGYVMPILDVHVSYKQALRFGDKAFVKTWLEENGMVKTVYRYEVVNKDESIVYVTGKTVHILVTKEGFSPVVFKIAAPDWYEKYETVAVKRN